MSNPRFTFSTAARSSLLCLTLSALMNTGAAVASEFTSAGCIPYARNQQWSQLVDYTTRWTQAEPGNGEAWYSLGNAYGSREHKIGVQEPEKAVAAYKEAVRLSPSSAKIWNALGHASFECGNRQDALNAFTRATQLEPNNGKYWNSLGSVNAMGSNPNDAQATADYRRAQSLGTRDAAHNNAIIHAPVHTTNNGWNFAPAQGGFRVDPYFRHINPTTGGPLINPISGRREYEN